MRRERTRMREGRLLAAVLAAAALLSLFVWQSRLPRSMDVEPVRAVQEESLIDRVDLNAATEEELSRLPGIGEALAARITAYRREKGGFRTVDELDEVPGIGKGKIAALEGLVFCG